MAFLAVHFCFFAAAVNVTITKADGGFDQDGLDGSNARHQDWLREDRMDAIDMEKLGIRGRCFVLEGEEQTRCHPNIFFFGVSKCGTTSMAKWITKHPQMRWVSRVKSSGLLKPGQEAQEAGALQMKRYKTKGDFADRYPFTAPEATAADPVIDCECVCVLVSSRTLAMTGFHMNVSQNSCQAKPKGELFFELFGRNVWSVGSSLQPESFQRFNPSCSHSLRRSLHAGAPSSEAIYDTYLYNNTAVLC